MRRTSVLGTHRPLYDSALMNIRRIKRRHLELTEDVAARLARSMAQRQRHPNCYKHPAAKLIEAFADASQPWADAIGHAGQEEFRGDLDGGEGAGHDDELQEQAAMRV